MPDVTRPEAAAYSEAQAAMRRMSATPGLELDLFAAEPLVKNIVSFTFDEHGAAYVVETGRRRTSVLDIRRNQEWLDDDFSFRTVQQRSNFFVRAMSPTTSKISDLNGDGIRDWRDFEVESERIRLVRDTNADGVADEARTFADGFDTLVSGVAAGVLARRGDIYFTCIPDLWLLRDANGDGVSDDRQSLHFGFGVHIGYGGHDMHGLIFGPDGKLYWSIADRGAHVEVDGEVAVDVPDSGAVFRCNPDGSELEVFAFGLRNPQELAFDQHGNLWTGENNGDGGDKARWMYLVEGSDSGWTLGWQWLPKMGAWNSEMLWGMPEVNTAKYLLAPIAHIGHGPAGLGYYPGTGLPDRFKHHFFMCDFPGGVRTFTVEPYGASYRVPSSPALLQNNSADTLDGKLLWGLYPVDVGFSPSGGVYVADWVEGWERTDQGRIFRLADHAVLQSALVQETKRLLAEGFDHRPKAELAALLGHEDQRVRQEAQFALVGQEIELRVRQRSSEDNALTAVALDANRPPLARLHAIWGLGMMSRLLTSMTDAGGAEGRPGPGTSLIERTIPLLSDGDPEVRAQAAKVLGESRAPTAFEPLIKALFDAHPRVRFYAAMSLGKLGNPEAVPAILEMVDRSEDQDQYLRHAAVMALVWINVPDLIIDAGHHPSEAVKLVSLLALRRLARPEAAMFLDQSSPQLVLEAARAIHDVPIPEAMPQLGALIDGRNGSITIPDSVVEPVLRRVINANYRLGKLENAAQLVSFSAQSGPLIALRVEALNALADWATPPARDKIVGLYRPLPERETRSASIPLQAELDRLFKDPAPAIQLAAIRAAVSLRIESAGPLLASLFEDRDGEKEIRLTALNGLAALKSDLLGRALTAAIADPDTRIRQGAAELQAEIDPAEAAAQLGRLLENGDIPQKQAALAALGGLPSPETSALLGRWLNQLIEGNAPREIRFDIIEAAARQNAPQLNRTLQQYNERTSASGELGVYGDLLWGGNAQAGRKVFFEDIEAACLRCHKVQGEGGEVGPDLTVIGAPHDRVYILESILYPNNIITTGFESILVTMKNGLSYAGQVKEETDSQLIINSLEDGLMTLDKANIQSRKTGLSAMPGEVSDILTRRELRDLVEFLATAN